MKRFLVLYVFLALLADGVPVKASIAVFVHDGIAVGKEEIMIKAETKGRFFQKGGQIIEIFIDGESIGRALSGGDGFAYKAFTPVKYGLYDVIVKHGESSYSGAIMSLRKGSSIVFIDVEGSLLSSFLAKENLDSAREAIGKIAEKHNVVYLKTGFIGVRSVKKLLMEKKFHESAVLPWNKGAIFNELIEKGIKIKAIIGGQEVIESAGKYKPEAFSFNESDSSKKVDSWEEIEKEINK